MWRVLFVVALLLFAGCAAEPPGSGTDAERPTDQRALTAENETLETNPWGKSNLTVAINNTANESRTVRPLVRHALDFWATNSTKYVGFPIDFDIESNATNPDLVIEFVDHIDSCANVTEPAGCAPYVTSDGAVSPPVTVEVVGSYSNESTRLILKHELGHVLGLNHSADPQSVMAPSSQLTTRPRPNATERRLPWKSPNLTVFLNTNWADDPQAAREQVQRALDYYGDGANGTVPANVSFEFVANRSGADVIIDFTANLPCREGKHGSCGRVRGSDPDSDDSLERYDRLRVALGEVDADAVGWHVGYWLGYSFGFEGDDDWPDSFRNTTMDERKSDWWKDG